MPFYLLYVLGVLKINKLQMTDSVFYLYLSVIKCIYLYICVMELLYERKNVNNVIRTQNEMLRILKLSLEDLAKEINRLQSKQITEPSKFGKQLKRNKQLQKALKKYQKDLYNKLDDTMQLKVSDSWGIANAKNDDLVRGFIGSIPTEFARPNLEQLEIFLKRKTKGLGLSERLWNLSNSSTKLVEDYLATGITQGKSANKIASELNRMINNPKGVYYTNDLGERVKFNKISDFLKRPRQKGQYKNPKDALKRLARNEINTAYRTSNYERMQQLDFVVGYEVHLSAAHDAYDICDSLAGKYPKNFIFTNWHVNCMCYVTSILMTKAEFKARQGSKREVKKVPVRMERLVKTMHAGKVEVKGSKSFVQMEWYFQNFKNGLPIKKVGGARDGVKAYKTRKDLTYKASSKKYLQKAKKGL